MNVLVFLMLWFGVTTQFAIPALEIHTEGVLTYYDEGMMQSVLRNRFSYDHLHPHYGYIPDCLVALNDDHVDEYVVLFYAGDFELCYVIDVAQKEHVKAREKLNLVAEVDYDTFRRMREKVPEYEDVEVRVAILGDSQSWRER